ncbi:MAG: GWxTD domain-containing protein [Anaerotruncus sp.]|nr:GWxTD domain-containing protein [Anaerotruncus sp.]
MNKKTRSRPRFSRSSSRRSALAAVGEALAGASDSGSRTSPRSSPRPSGPSSTSSRPTPTGPSSSASSGGCAIPYPDTTENEFQKEYEERVRYADQNFGHYSPKRGSQTDRGFFYVVLGQAPRADPVHDPVAGLAPGAVVLQGGRGIRPAGLFLPHLLPARGDRRFPSLLADGRGPGEAGHPEHRAALKPRPGPNAYQAPSRASTASWPAPP